MDESRTKTKIKIKKMNRRLSEAPSRPILVTDKDTKNKKLGDDDGKGSKSNKDGKKSSDSKSKTTAKPMLMAVEAGEKKGSPEFCDCKEYPFIHSKYYPLESKAPLKAKQESK